MGRVRQPGELPVGTRHGLHGSPYYNMHYQMLERCYNPAHPKFENYGGRGIRVEEALQNVVTFARFIEAELGARPSGSTLDRIDNDGDYARGNLRWASRSEQTHNQREAVRHRDYPRGGSGYHGVLWIERVQRWRSRCGGRDTYHLTAEEAAHAYDSVARARWGENAKVNFP